MTTQTIGIIVNGATSRIGSTQHLANALVPIIQEGGLLVDSGRVLPRLLLVGRDPDRVAAIARLHNIADWSSDLDAALSDPSYSVFFDAASTSGRSPRISMSIPRNRWHPPRRRDTLCCRSLTRAGYGTAWWRTRFICRACKSSLR